MAKTKAKNEEMDQEEVGDNEVEDGKNDDVEDNFSEFNGVIEQIKAEYNFASTFIKPKWDKWLTRLKLYNNQKRDPDAIGDPLLFTIHQTVLASLYADQLTIEFEGREHGDDDMAENLNALAKFDAIEMDKAELDYEWDWDALFFGRSYKLMYEFDRDTMTPVPEIIDPLTFYRDPDATSVNGDKRGRGAARFFGREIRLTEREMEESGVYKNIDKLNGDDTALTTVEQNRQQRREAQGFDTLRQKLTGESAGKVLLEWFTWWKGKRYIFTLGNDMGCLVRATEIKTKGWPVVDRACFPIAHDWDGVSIGDLVEDKQRARAVVQNLAVKGVKAGLYPNYLYNNMVIKNKSALAKIDFNKFTGVAGNPQGAVVPIERNHITTDVSWILSVLDGAAQKSTATPDIQQGAMAGTVKSATEIAKVSQGVDTRYSLAAKIFGWSEKKEWRLWYELLSLHYKSGIDKKVIRVNGPLGPTWREIRRENIIGNADPDIVIESKVVSDAKRMNKLNMWMGYMNQAVAMDKDANRRFFLKQIGKTMGLSSEEINRALPKTFDEFEAEQENEQLNDGKMPKISVKQNHQVHIEVHSKAMDGKQKDLHIKMHQLAMYMMRENPALVAPGVPGVSSGQGEAPMSTGKAPAPRDMAQSPLQLQAPNAVQS